MKARAAPTTTIRRARAADVEAILDLLTHYDLPRTAFESSYCADPTYRPEDSWLVERNGRLVAHLRIYGRVIYLGSARLRVAGVGNVVTHRDERGHGYAGQLLAAVLAALPSEGYAYSLLWTHLPAMYARYGWAPIAQEQARACLPLVDGAPVREGWQPQPSRQASPSLTPFTAADLPAVRQLYETANARRTGPTVRSAAHWQAQLAAPDEDRAGFLLARSADGSLMGYARRRLLPAVVELLELEVAAHDLPVARALLAAAAAPRAGSLLAHLPPSLRPALPLESVEATTDMGLMGRVLDLGALVHALASCWQERLQAARLSAGTVDLHLHCGRATLHLPSGRIGVAERSGAESVPALDERTLAHLLFHGADPAAQGLLDHQPAEPFLRALFPPQDFVLWPVDAF